MRVLVQLVNNALVTIEGKEKSQIGKGLVLYLGIEKADADKDIQYLIDKIITLRIFPNKKDKFDKSLSDEEGELLIISQFTLFADVSKGRRPYFKRAETPLKASFLYNKFVEAISSAYKRDKIKTGKFGAKMIVNQENLGPVTIILSSRNEQ
ncbi:MAG: D-aminoacyl-tRNA deacylase [Candidatus Dojkabacteria bacterium]|nr:D-aminoacyl-tRNA deacylase [Candidatus Dojkabacteria bacterium]